MSFNQQKPNETNQGRPRVYIQEGVRPHFPPMQNEIFAAGALTELSNRASTTSVSTNEHRTSAIDYQSSLFFTYPDRFVQSAFIPLCLPDGSSASRAGEAGWIPSQLQNYTRGGSDSFSSYQMGLRTNKRPC